MNEIYPYERKVFYYETDKMAIVHHSNYVRWMEEARVFFLEQVGAPFEKIEEMDAQGYITKSTTERAQCEE